MKLLQYDNKFDLLVHFSAYIVEQTRNIVESVSLNHIG